MGGSCVQVFPAGIAKMMRLQFLNLSHNKLVKVRIKGSANSIGMEILRKAAALSVDAARAAKVRRVAGYPAYEAQQQEVWSEAKEAAAAADLGSLPLFCMGRCNFSAGSTMELLLSEVRYQTMISRAVAPGV